MPDHAIQAILLDAGGVLVLPHHEILLETALGSMGLVPDPDQLDRAHYEGGRTLAVWPEDEETLWAQWNRSYLTSLGMDPTDEQVDLLSHAFRRFDMWTRPAPGAREGLAAIAATGVKIAIVSNADGTVEHELGKLGMCQVGPGPGVTVDAVIDSEVVGVAKPDPRIFHIALERLGVDAAAAIHVGDIIGADVAGATSAGVHPVHFDPYGLCEAADHDHATTLVEVAALVR